MSTQEKNKSNNNISLINFTDNKVFKKIITNVVIVSVLLQQMACVESVYSPGSESYLDSRPEIAQSYDHEIEQMPEIGKDCTCFPFCIASLNKEMGSINWTVDTNRLKSAIQSAFFDGTIVENLSIDYSGVDNRYNLNYQWRYGTESSVGTDSIWVWETNGDISFDPDQPQPIIFAIIAVAVVAVMVSGVSGCTSCEQSSPVEPTCAKCHKAPCRCKK